MNLKTKIEALEITAKHRQKQYDLDLGNGRIVRVNRAQIRQIIDDINGSSTGLRPAPSRCDRKIDP